MRRRHLNESQRQKPAADRRLVLGVCIFLIAIVWIVFGQTLHHEFVNFDDYNYIQKRPEITSGLMLSGIVWALTRSHTTNLDWDPLSYISHMADYQLYGAEPGGHHFSNILLHTIATLLLFLLLRRITGALWRSAFVAVLFAIHPLHVEAVAWVADRKSVLSGVFFMLTLDLYLSYVRNPSTARYVAMSILFALGLMSKSILVTLPFVLLLLDYWPLGRFGETVKRRSIARLTLEKIPLFLLSAASCAITVFARQKVIMSVEALSLSLRMTNALTGYVVYIWEMIWPAKLAVFYPHLYERLPLWEALGALVLLVAVTAIAFVLRKRHPYFITGWLWYLIMLLPVIGIVQVGEQAHADRYTYLPHIGLYLIVSWGLVDLTARWRVRREVLGTAAAITVMALAWCAAIQASYWRDSESLWTHTLAVTTNNDVAHNNLGFTFYQRGQVDDAIVQFREALKTDAGAGRHGFAVVLAHYNLGFALAQRRQIDEAIAEFEKAVALSPEYADAHFNLGNALFEKGRIDEAIAHWQKTLSIQPDDAEARTSLAYALLQKGELREAIAHYIKTLEIAPNSVWALNDLAWVRATSSDDSLRNGGEGIELAEKADQLSQKKNPIFIRTLAAAHAENGNFPKALEVAERALQLAIDQGQAALAHEMQRDITLYRANAPLRNISSSNATPSP